MYTARARETRRLFHLAALEMTELIVFGSPAAGAFLAQIPLESCVFWIFYVWWRTKPKGKLRTREGGEKTIGAKERFVLYERAPALIHRYGYIRSVIFRDIYETKKNVCFLTVRAILQADLEANKRGSYSRQRRKKQKGSSEYFAEKPKALPLNLDHIYVHSLSSIRALPDVSYPGNDRRKLAAGAEGSNANSILNLR